MLKHSGMSQHFIDTWNTASCDIAKVMVLRMAPIYQQRYAVLLFGYTLCHKQPSLVVANNAASYNVLYVWLLLHFTKLTINDNS